MTEPRSFAVGPAADRLPDGLVPLARRATDEGLRIVSAVIDGWVDRSQRFDGPGESILTATASNGAVVGIGGITICPTVDGALRVRRFYVDPDWRRHGVAEALATPLIRRGLQVVRIITCNAGGSEAAPPFWEAMGFEPVDVPGITHTLVRSEVLDHP